MAYALAVVVAPKEMPCEIRVTSPTSVKIFLNGSLAHGHDEYHHGAPFDGIVGKGVLKKGENVVVLKVCQNDQTGGVGAGVGVPDADLRRHRRPAAARTEAHDGWELEDRETRL